MEAAAFIFAGLAVVLVGEPVFSPAFRGIVMEAAVFSVGGRVRTLLSQSMFFLVSFVEGRLFFLIVFVERRAFRGEAVLSAFLVLFTTGLLMGKGMGTERAFPMVFVSFIAVEGTTRGVAFVRLIPILEGMTTRVVLVPIFVRTAEGSFLL